MRSYHIRHGPPSGGVDRSVPQKSKHYDTRLCYTIPSFLLRPVHSSRPASSSPLSATFSPPSLPPLVHNVHNGGNTAFWTFVPLTYCTTHLEEAPGILHY
eukprot:7764538-Pyramimonas_sp.AAC.1